jgi:hypothetical protein
VENIIVPWGLGVVQWVQSFRNPLLDSFFLTINYFGEAYFFLALIPLLYWCIHKQFGYRFALVLGFSTYLNLVLKDFFATPRPYQVDTSLYVPAKETTYGTQASTRNKLRSRGAMSLHNSDAVPNASISCCGRLRIQFRYLFRSAGCMLAFTVHRT